MKQYRDLLQEWVDHYSRNKWTPAGSLLERTKKVIKQGGFPCTCERCTGIPDAESYYKDDELPTTPENILLYTRLYPIRKSLTAGYKEKK